MENIKEIKEKLNLNDEQIKSVNYRLLQEYEVPDWVKITKEKDREIDQVEHVEIGGKEMRVRKHVNYCEDNDMDFFDGSLSEERSHLQRKRKKENSLSGLDSFDQEISRSNKKRKLGSESNSIRQNKKTEKNKNEKLSEIKMLDDFIEHPSPLHSDCGEESTEEIKKDFYENQKKERLLIVEKKKNNK